MRFVLNFALISYAAVLFFSIGLGLALSSSKALNLAGLALIFSIAGFCLSLVFLQEPLQIRIMIAFIWTAVLGSGFRFGKKIRRSKDSPS